MDADVLYPARMLERLIRSSHPTALLLDRDYSTKDDDPVLVPVKDGRPFEFRKTWTGEADFVGESIGFFKIAPGDLPILIDETRERSAGSDVRDSYDDVLRAMVLADRFGFEDVTSLPWTEIDFPDDLAVARDEVLPQIERIADSL
jgi:choline kinase